MKLIRNTRISSGVTLTNWVGRLSDQWKIRKVNHFFGLGFWSSKLHESFWIWPTTTKQAQNLSSNAAISTVQHLRWYSSKHPACTICRVLVIDDGVLCQKPWDLRHATISEIWSMHITVVVMIVSLILWLCPMYIFILAPSKLFQRRSWQCDCVHLNQKP